MQTWASSVPNRRSMMKDRQQVKFTSVDQMEFSRASQDQTEDIWKMTWRRHLELEVFPWTHSESNRRRKCQQFHRRWMTSAAWMRRLRFVLPHPNTLKQNSEEYSQEWKSSTLQVQDQIHGLRDQIWATGLNSSTSQYGAQEQAVEYLVKCLIRIAEQTKSFLMFHIYFTARRILFEMGGSKSAAPGDPTFN